MDWREDASIKTILEIYCADVGPCCMKWPDQVILKKYVKEMLENILLVLTRENSADPPDPSPKNVKMQKNSEKKQGSFFKKLALKTLAQRSAP